MLQLYNIQASITLSSKEKELSNVEIQVDLKVRDQHNNKSILGNMLITEISQENFVKKKERGEKKHPL